MTYIGIMTDKKEDLLLASLTEFFASPENLVELENILTRKNGISLRNIEWFVTNYSKERSTKFKTRSGVNIDVHIAYKSSLGGYSKRLFDPFCRTERIEFKGFITTIAQLNFIRWSIRNGIIDFIRRELPQIHSELKGPHTRNNKDTEYTTESTEGPVTLKTESGDLSSLRNIH